MPGRRVVITGAGAVTAAGVGCAAFHDAVWSGTSRIKPIAAFAEQQLPIRIGGEIDDFRPEEYLDRKTIARTPRNTHFAFIAADEAFASAGLNMAEEDPTRVGSVMGTTIGGTEAAEKGIAPFFAKGPRFVSPFLVTTMLCNGAMSQIAIKHNLQGVTQTVVSETAGGADAIRIGAELIRDGELDVALVGGCESTLWPGFVLMFAGLGDYVVAQGDPASAYRPFDRDAAGMVLGEGAGLLLLESEEHARARGATLLAEVAGYGATFDAADPFGFGSDGVWYAAALQKAMKMAGIGPESIDAVVAEGRGTPASDAAELQAFAGALGGARVPVTCVKGAVGHTFSAAGALDAICALGMLGRGGVPPVTNLAAAAGGGGGLDLVAGAARRVPVGAVLLGARGLGGVNLGLVLRRIEAQ